MKKLMRARRFQALQILEVISRVIDSRRVGVLHATTCRSMRKVINEGIGIEWPIVHPPNLSRGDLLQRIHNGLQAVISGIGIDDDAILRSVLREITFCELAQLDRAVHKPIVVGSPKKIAGRDSWRCRRTVMGSSRPFVGYISSSAKFRNA